MTTWSEAAASEAQPSFTAGLSAARLAGAVGTILMVSKSDDSTRYEIMN